MFVGMGIGSIIWPEFATYYINPLNLKPDYQLSPDFPDEKYKNKLFIKCLQNII